MARSFRGRRRIGRRAPESPCETSSRWKVKGDPLPWPPGFLFASLIRAGEDFGDVGLSHRVRLGLKSTVWGRRLRRCEKGPASFEHLRGRSSLHRRSSGDAGSFLGESGGGLFCGLKRQPQDALGLAACEFVSKRPQNFGRLTKKILQRVLSGSWGPSDLRASLDQPGRFHRPLLSLGAGNFGGCRDRCPASSSLLRSMRTVPKPGGGAASSETGFESPVLLFGTRGPRGLC